MSNHKATTACSMQGTWPDGTTWKYYEGGNFTHLSPQAAFGIYVRHNAILLTQNQRGWDIPGGTKEDFETIRETMVREVLEEGGLIVTSEKPIGYLLISLPNTDGKEVCVAGYMVETTMPLQAITGTECKGAKLCDLNGDECKSSAKQPLIDFILRDHNS
jgi:8-oxo-dGTP pyrophosphatase MutT (NUDIX family)